MKTPALRKIQVRVQVELAVVSEVKRFPRGVKKVIIIMFVPLNLVFSLIS